MKLFRITVLAFLSAIIIAGTMTATMFFREYNRTYVREFSSHSSLGFRFRDGYSLVPGDEGRVGVIDATGKIVLKTHYSLISDEYRNRIRVVELRTDDQLKYGLIDSCFTFILPIEYEDIKPSRNGIIISKNNQKSLISYDDYSTVIASHIWEEIEPMYYQKTAAKEESCSKIFSGLFRVKLDYYHYGVIDSQGQVLIEPIWESVKCLSPDLFSVEERREKYLVNKCGEFIR